MTDDRDSDSDPDATLERVEGALERATDLDDEAAADALREARRDVRELRSADVDVDEGRRRTLETQLDQRLREVGERDRYGGELGAAMNPDEEDAP